jgi:hypothetical protein
MELHYNSTIISIELDTILIFICLAHMYEDVTGKR